MGAALSRHNPLVGRRSAARLQGGRRRAAPEPGLPRASGCACWRSTRTPRRPCGGSSVSTLAGAGYRMIAAGLNRDGVPCPSSSRPAGLEDGPAPALPGPLRTRVPVPRPGAVFGACSAPSGGASVDQFCDQSGIRAGSVRTGPGAWSRRRSCVRPGRVLGRRGRPHDRRRAQPGRRAVPRIKLKDASLFSGTTSTREVSCLSHVLMIRPPFVRPSRHLNRRLRNSASCHFL